MSKKYIIFILLCMPVFQVTAQKLLIKKADYYFESLAFHDAIPCYEKAIKKDSSNIHVYRQLAESYRLTDQPEQAVEMYTQLLAACDTNASDLFNYSRVLRSAGKYIEAEQRYTEYLALTDNNDGASRDVKAFINDLKKDSSWFYISPASVNTPHSDFAPAFYKQKYLVFASSGHMDNESHKKYQWNNQLFLDLYYSRIKFGKNLGGPRQFIDGVNTKFHEGAVCFAEDDRYMYFTRDNYQNKHKKLSNDGTLHLALFKLKVRGRDRGNITSVSVNNEAWSVGHPAISPGSEQLYFVSNMPGGYGGSDLYYCEIYGDSLGLPVNCGTEINTPGDELFPCIHPDGTLYIASDGHPGLGGLDIFECKKAGKKYTSPKNLGYPVNTRFDDFSITIDQDKVHGYFASNRPGGKGDDDIYYVRFLKNEPTLISGKILDAESNKPLPGITMCITNTANDTIKEVDMLKDGSFAVYLEPGQTYQVVSGYYGTSMSTEIDLTSSSAKKEISDVMISFHRPTYKLTGKTLDKESGEFIPGARVYLKTIDKILIDSCRSAKDGSFEFHIDKAIAYDCNAKKSGYFGSVTRVSFEHVQENTEITQDVYLDKLEVNKSIAINNIYYDYNKSHIRKDAAKELDRLVELLEQNPDMTIELSSHTDSRGNRLYNKRLSNARAKAATSYIIQNGIDRRRITSKGYGEEQLLNHCDDGTDCTEEQHQQNRRTEFKIIGM